MKTRSFSNTINFTSSNAAAPNKNVIWSREKCNTGAIMLSAALLDGFAVSKIASKIPSKKMHLLGKDGIVGMVILALGGIASLLFNSFDKKHPNNKVGNFFFTLMNGPKANQNQ